MGRVVVGNIITQQQQQEITIRPKMDGWENCPWCLSCKWCSVDWRYCWLRCGSVRFKATAARAPGGCVRVWVEHEKKNAFLYNRLRCNEWKSNMQIYSDMARQRLQGDGWQSYFLFSWKEKVIFICKIVQHVPQPILSIEANNCFACLFFFHSEKFNLAQFWSSSDDDQGHSTCSEVKASSFVNDLFQIDFTYLLCF